MHAAFSFTWRLLQVQSLNASAHDGSAKCAGRGFD